MREMAVAVEDVRLRAASDELKLTAGELPKASNAATTIQKHFRGMVARKQYALTGEGGKGRKWKVNQGVGG